MRATNRPTAPGSPTARRSALIEISPHLLMPSLRGNKKAMTTSTDGLAEIHSTPRAETDRRPRGRVRVDYPQRSSRRASPTDVARPGVCRRQARVRRQCGCPPTLVAGDLRRGTRSAWEDGRGPPVRDRTREVAGPGSASDPGPAGLPDTGLPAVSRSPLASESSRPPLALQNTGKLHTAAVWLL